MQRTIVLAALLLLAGCGASVDRLGAECEEMGLTPGMADFEQCHAAALATPKDLSLQHETARQMMFGR